MTKLAELVGIDDPGEMAEAMYPSTGKDKYDPNRTEEDLPAPIAKTPPIPGPQPAPAAVAATLATAQQAAPASAVKEAFARLAEAVGKVLNGTHAD